jgi:hypothetical protein
MEQTPKPKSKKKLVLIVLGGLLGLCVLCVAFGTILNSTPTARATQTVQAIALITQEAMPTNTPTNTSTPEPTNTPTPTNTPVPPTNTPEPTNTPTPTSTSTPLPDPVVLTGSGDDIVDFENPFNIAIAHIVGNAGGRHFAIINYGADGSRYDLLVNTTDPYDGIKPIDFGSNEHTTRFEVKAAGSWTITVMPVTSAKVLDVPGKIEGSGDDVIFLIGGTPDVATVVGNQQGRHFAVVGYGNRRNLLVNTTDPYEGKVVLGGDVRVLVVTGVGSWLLDVEAR